MSIYDEPTFDGMSEAVAMGMVMEPPEGFLERAVARGLAFVQAEEALVDLTAEEASSPDPAANDRPNHLELEARPTDPIPPERETQPYLRSPHHEAPGYENPGPRRRHDSGVIRLAAAQDDEAAQEVAQRVTQQVTQQVTQHDPDDSHRE
jgi:hypothetical protein